MSETAREIRDELLARNWPLSAEVHRSNSGDTADPAQWARDMRDACQLLGVWSAAERTYRYPAFQFDAAGVLLPRINELLSALAALPDFTPESDLGGWRRAFCLHGTTRGLLGPEGDAIPAELFRADPGAVIAWARKYARNDLNELW